jgi:glycosyltransferase involved in cell wall biosynthesis
LKIIVFIENIQNGGVDTFFSTLMNNWPNSDDVFTVICNKSHPGRKNMENSINRPCEFIYHNIPLSWTFSKRVFFFFPYFVRRAFQPFLRIPFFPLQYLLIRNIFRKNDGNELLVINGGFPGGESCRIANIVWHKMGRGQSIHNFHNFAVAPRFGFGWFENWVDRLLLKSTKLFVSVSKSCSDSLKIRKTFKNLTNNIYIYNGVNDTSIIKNNFNIRKNIGVDDNPLCLMLGTYETRKGHQFIFKAFEKVVKTLPNAHLVVCGGGTKNEIIKVNKLKSELIAAADNIHLFEFIPIGASLISQADVLLIGSQEFESFGLTAVEAMIRKKPVVSTNVGGLPEVLGTDNNCGFVVNHKDTVAFSENIILLLKNKELRDIMGISGRDRALKLFSADRMSSNYLAAIKS